MIEDPLMRQGSTCQALEIEDLHPRTEHVGVRTRAGLERHCDATSGAKRANTRSDMSQLLSEQRPSIDALMKRRSRTL